MGRREEEISVPDDVDDRRKLGHFTETFLTKILGLT